MKLTLEEKLQNVKRHLYDDVPIWEIKKKYGLQRSIILGTRSRNGTGGMSMMKKAGTVPVKG